MSPSYSWFAEDYETSDFLCQAVERQKAEEVLMVSAWEAESRPVELAREFSPRGSGSMASFQAGPLE
jgi:hypothetical protein